MSHKHCFIADDIYRDDVVFRDPRNTFRGLKNYKTIFWSLRFHGRLFFKILFVDVQRIWQPDDSQIRYLSSTCRAHPHVQTCRSRLTQISGIFCSMA